MLVSQTDYDFFSSPSSLSSSSSSAVRVTTRPRVPSHSSSPRNSSPPFSLLVSKKRKIEPIYRSNRSRSTSQFPSLDSETQSSLFKRRWRTEQHGNSGDGFLGSEDIVRRLVKSYKTCVCYLSAPQACFSLITDFKNPNDPNDISFEAHPENYPLAELEYPNTGAKERFFSSEDALLALSNHVLGSFFSHLKTRTTIIRLWILKSPC